MCGGLLLFFKKLSTGEVYPFSPVFIPLMPVFILGKKPGVGFFASGPEVRPMARKAGAEWFRFGRDGYPEVDPNPDTRK